MLEKCEPENQIIHPLYSVPIYLFYMSIVYWRLLLRM